MYYQTFGVFDYVIFGITLCFSIVIGVYFGCFGNKQKSAKEYLYGNGNMNAIPIGLSLYSSAISSITIIGNPAEIYVFGSQIMLTGLGSLLSLVITWNLILPVFCGALEIKTPYEYFELRYDKKVRIISSVIYILHTLLYMPVVLYTSTLTLSDATGIPLAISTTVIGGICVFYTMLGGFSSVIWTDTFQATLMLCSCIFVMVNGILQVGGLEEVWRRADQGKRIRFFDMNPNPFERLTMWSAVIGMTFNFASHSGCSASTIQRYMSLANEKQAKISTFIGAFGYVVITIVTGILGLCIYALYYDCDPVKYHGLDSPTQILPYYIAETIGNTPGFSGLFAAGLLSAGLSTLSAELNTVSGLIYHDFIQKFYKKHLTESEGAQVMKIIVLINGIIYMVAAPCLEKVKYLFQVALIIGGFTYGAKLGTMILATSFPKSNSQGVIWGVISSLSVLGWIAIGASYYNVGSPYALDMSVTNCSRNMNVTDIITTTNSLNATSYMSNITFLPYLTNTSHSVQMTSTAEPLYIYKLSFLLYPFVGTIVTVLVGLLVSYITGSNNVNDIDTRLLIPYYRTQKYNSKPIPMNIIGDIEK